MKQANKILAAVASAYAVIGAISVALMMLHITADVIGKFVFNQPLPGTIPIVSQFYMVFATFLPLAMVERANSHISVEIIVQNFPKRMQDFIAMLACALGTIMFGLLTWRALIEAGRKYSVGTFSYEQGHKILTWPTYYIVPLGTGLLTLVMFYKLACYFTGYGDDTPPAKNDVTTQGTV
ncbi:tripartite ATP-independent periplasmic transporter, DctQ component (plasmid) [Pseudosulfitobacter pseudonitzschiae]|jgi:TRAP-type C4-dicarboxylate transport system permease small subunit|uniref:TRAP transporter small permease protein n=1 Tax=Pseudosulfitobacter pseudonitzschiae TaxID=1402135 RepID=A0A221K8W9_9RHOB|nr:MULTISPECIES: TRAP transporter small permease [Roseobacteraceae]ASM75303.1 tripartite ATP-independent periplasmic transporter, DctQ component [Pseudosulfitobacter pseudonitzschiae]|tara:strand:+ start:10035 stop:10574 length:540 start_codon:yes stop_codon:yes gene_type:complete